MSIQAMNNQIASLDREIYNIERQVQIIEGNINRKQKEANAILNKINKEKDLKRIITYQNDLARKNDEIVRFEKDKSSKSMNISEKQKKKYDLQQKLIKEEQKERDVAKKEQKEILSIQQQISREMEKQKYLSFHTIKTTRLIKEQKEYDVFISHASEDKDDFVRLFAEALRNNGLIIWYDEFSLRVGDSLREAIDKGLKNSRYGIVILSEAFFKKEWPKKELNGLFAREVNGEKVILPIWHKVSKNDVLNFSPILADMLAINTSTFTIEEIAVQIAERVKAG